MRYKAVLSLLGYLIVLSYVSWWQVVDFVLSECMWLVFYNLFQCQVQQNSLCWSRHVSPTKRQENGKQRDASGLAGVDYQDICDLNPRFIFQVESPLSLPFLESIFILIHTIIMISDHDDSVYQYEYKLITLFIDIVDVDVGSYVIRWYFWCYCHFSG